MEFETTDLDQADRRTGIAPIASMMFVWLLILAASHVSYAPVKPAAENADANSFSSWRAKSILEKLIGDGIPHPAGSEQNKVVRKRVIDFLESWGYEVEVQSGDVVVGGWNDGQRVEETIKISNLIAIKPGIRRFQDAPALMLVSHYDSVSSGPGASDDGVGTAAVLEIARMLANEPMFDRDIVFLITDAEESGTLGAKLFVDEHPLAQCVGLMVNVEARGTTGPSMMFETSYHSRMLIPILAKSVNKPHTSSLFFEIYRRMPNYTDFSVLRKPGILGFNFAFIGDVRNYHTPQDNFENVDFGSMQHHGENMLGIVKTVLAEKTFDRFLDSRNFGPEPASIDPANEAVYFDFFGLMIIWWPMNWTMHIVGVLTIVCLMTMFFCWRHRDCEMEPKSVWGIAAPFILLLISFAAISVSVWGILQLIQLDSAMATSWPQHPIPIAASLWLVGLAVAGWLSVLFSKWFSPLSSWIAMSLFGLLLAFLSTWFVAGTSYLFIAPVTLSVAGSFVVSLFWNRASFIHGWWLVFATALIWLPLDRLFYDAVGFGRWPLLVGKTALIATSIICVLAVMNKRAKRRFALFATFAGVAALIVSVFLNMTN